MASRCELAQARCRGALPEASTTSSKEEGEEEEKQDAEEEEMVVRITPSKWL